MITDLKKGEVAEILPLNAIVQGLHAKMVPGQFYAAPEPARLKSFYDDWVNDPDKFILVAREDGQAVGYAAFSVTRREGNPFVRPQRNGEVDQIAVRTDRQGRGIGTALIKAGKARLVAVGCHTISASYHVFNTASARLMEKNGLNVRVMRVGAAL
ncbi:hypothetical protein ACMU_03410 [Actibacterium mucosum KCTC 23349]|uniref:N-acetyltransferase domain-containing protein n=1 Tax=Actibacterium mucosum KCTC 23349 TaxID=1454373 RepID=A0A037ZCB3_9RHOB|nr:GNAT family N-acetyltransferase [Actibacterium mucosum]KAJ54144.1 hypothetical protein ACMU_03410 [Actibacterium mucosum KCTC 23349]